MVNESSKLVTLFASNESEAVISWSNGILEMSIPVHPLKRTSPPITEAYFFRSSYFSHASSSVLPTMGVKVPKNLIDCGSRPFSAASLRIFAIFGFNTSGEWEETKIASACVEANSDPAGEVPAWKRNGVRCGDGSTMCRVLNEKYLPLWPIG